MNDPVFLLLGAISIFANRAAEAVKAFLAAHYPDIRAEVVSEIALGVSLVAGMVGALALNVNLLTLLPAESYLAQIPPLAGVLVTGCIASLGSEGIHWLTDLLAAGRDRLTPAQDAWIVEELPTPPTSAERTGQG